MERLTPHVFTTLPLMLVAFRFFEVPLWLALIIGIFYGYYVPLFKDKKA